ncbi:hypothetical protein GC170_03090 [bacterium]|nr:hypothetical protein [bacterium]
MPSDLVPLWLNWHGRHVLVVGMGAVGQRRALTFQRAGATVIGIDPVPAIQGSEWGELIRAGLDLKAEPYAPEIFDELELSHGRPDLVLACATRAVNARVVADAIARGLWVASATSEPDRTEDPSTAPNAHLGAVRAGDYLKVAVHSGNVAPALAAAVGDHIARALLPAADRLAQEAARWRQRIVSDQSLAPELRKRCLSAAGDPDRLRREVEMSGAGVEDLRRFLTELLGPLPTGESATDAETMP